uniref:Uncharacterized protein n=1 Tax=Anguilla anguilla TaxID=7936 RepID=A0A0E9WY35_ANGAN
MSECKISHCMLMIYPISLLVAKVPIRLVFSTFFGPPPRIKYIHGTCSSCPLPDFLHCTFVTLVSDLYTKCNIRQREPE